jgi:hypothetical protein
MNKFFKILSSVSVIVGLIIAGFFVYDRWIKPEQIEIEIKRIDATQLTKLPPIDGLTASFHFKDSLVSNLWRVKYIFTNIGTKTVIGDGIQRNIIENKLKLYFKDSVSILDMQITNKNFPVVLLDNKLSFKQWRPKEFIEIITFVEPKTKQTIPTIEIDERDLIDGRIINSVYFANEKKKDLKSIDYFPIWLKSALKWIIVIIIFITFLGLILGVKQQQKTDVSVNSPATKVILYISVFIFWLLFATPLLWIF